LHEEIRRNSNNTKVELDIYLPTERLAFEYQGEHHFYDIYALGPQWYQQERDEEKRKVCKELGITLIEIPYWWDRTNESLMATIHNYRPDLCSKPQKAKPIPNEPPST
jgi:hypothetical protein